MLNVCPRQSSAPLRPGCYCQQTENHVPAVLLGCDVQCVGRVASSNVPFVAVMCHRTVMCRLVSTTRRSRPGYAEPGALTVDTRALHSLKADAAIVCMAIVGIGRRIPPE